MMTGELLKSLQTLSVCCGLHQSTKVRFKYSACLVRHIYPQIQAKCMKGAFYTQDFSLVPENTELYTAYTHTHMDGSFFLA